MTQAVNVGIRFELEGVLPTFDEPPTQVAGETTRTLEQGRRLAGESSRLRPVHLLVAMREHHTEATGMLSWLGLGTGRLRRYAGLPHTAPVLAEGLPRDTPAAVGHGPLVLLGGGTHGVAPVLSCLAELGVPPGGRAAFVLAASPQPGRPWLRSVGCPFADSDLEVADAGLARRPDAFDDAVLDRLRAADVIIVPGGHTERLFDALWGTLALKVLAERSNAGVPIVGSSAGAIVWGRAVLTNWETEDEDVPLPLLRWLPDTLIEAHWVADRSEKPVLALREAYPDLDVLGPSHHGGVLVRDGHVTDLYPTCTRTARRTCGGRVRPPLSRSRGRASRCHAEGSGVPAHNSLGSGTRDTPGGDARPRCAWSSVAIAPAS